MHNSPKFFITPMCAVHCDELYLYGYQEWVGDRPPRNAHSLSNLLVNCVHGKLSEKAKSKAKRAIKYLLFTAVDKKVYNPKFNSSYKFKVSFITLTLPSKQVHTDKVIKAQLLNQFLIEAKKRWSLINYVWKSEKQGNGNIHFHILCDIFIPHWELRQVWNRIVNKLGYVDNYRAQHHKSNPNSTDIHSLYKVKNVYNYITKYMTKPEHKRHNTIKASLLPVRYLYTKGTASVSIGAKKFLNKESGAGRIWSCSYSLSNIDGGKEELSEALLKEIEQLQLEKGSRRVDRDYISAVYFNHSSLIASKFPLLSKLFFDFVRIKFGDKTKYITYPPLPPDNIPSQP